MDRAALKDFRLRVVGRRETVKWVLRDQAAEVYVARDADPAIVSQLEEHCRTHAVPIRYIESLTELGQMCGIEVGAACAAVARAGTDEREGGRTSADH